MVSAELGHTEVAEVLIRNGADLQVQEKVCKKLDYILGSCESIIETLIRAEGLPFTWPPEEVFRRSSIC